MSKEVRAKFVSIEQALDPEENTAPKVGGALVQFHDEVEVANSDLKLQIKQAELDRDKNKGIFGTLSSLEQLYPRTKTKAEWYAFVGTDNPRERYHVTADGGDWLATGDKQNVGEVDLADYAKSINASGDKVVYSKDGKMPDGVLTADNIAETIEGVNKVNLSKVYHLEPVDMDYEWVRKSVINNYGGVENDSRTDRTEAYIPVESGQTYNTQGFHAPIYYDENKVFKRVAPVNRQDYLIPEGVAYLRLNVSARPDIELTYPLIRKHVYGKAGDTIKVDLGVEDLRKAAPLPKGFEINEMPKNVAIFPKIAIGYQAVLLEESKPTSQATTDFIPVQPNTIYKVLDDGVNQAILRLYDVNKGYLTYFSQNDVRNGFKTPLSAAYVRIKVQQGAQAKCRLINVTASTSGGVTIPNLIIPQANVQSGEEVKVEMIHIGDSHSTGNGNYTDWYYTPWIQLVANALKVDLTNIARGGAHIVPTSDPNTDNMRIQMNKIPPKFNGIISIMMGTNDFINSYNRDIVLGEIESALTKSASSLKETITYEAFRKYLIELRDTFPNAHIIAYSPIYLVWYNDKFPAFLEFSKNLGRICEYESIPFYKLGEGCWTKNSKDMPDQLHPNPAGIYKMAIGGLPYIKGIVDARRLLGASGESI